MKLMQEPKDFEFVGPGDIMEISSILGQRTYNNIIYTGKSGVGKTANLYGLVGIQNKDPSKTELVLPLHMINKKFWLLNTSLVFDNDIKSNLEEVINILEAPGDNVLVIEDANDLLKAIFDNNLPSIIPRLMDRLKDKDFQTIWMVREGNGADKQLEEVLNCHSDINELFTVLRKEDPDKETIYKIALTRRIPTEVHHDGLHITEDACKEVVDLTMTHSSLSMYQRRQPARTLRVLTSIASKYLTDITNETGHSEEYNDAVRKLQKLNASMTKIEITVEKSEKELNILVDALTEKLQENSEGIPSKLTINSNKSIEIKELEKIILFGNKDLNDVILPKIHRIKEELNVSLTLDIVNVKSIFSDISGIPSDDLDDSEAEKVKNIAPRMKEEVYGQDPVIDAIASSIKRASAGLKKPGQPIGSFVMVGSSGVGKSYIAKMLAKVLFNDEKKLKIFDMSEFMNESALSRMIGAAPGLVGYGNGGELLNVVRKNPHTVILLDEIEKASPDIFTILLQVLDDGRLTDELGTVDFSNAIIIMTTNLAQELSLDDAIDPSSQDTRDLIMKAMLAVFKQELINRVDQFVLFKALTNSSIYKIIERREDEINNILKDKNITLTIENKMNYIEDRYIKKEGSRQILKYIANTIEANLADYILDNPKGGTMDAVYKNNEFVVEFKENV